MIKHLWIKYFLVFLPLAKLAPCEKTFIITCATGALGSAAAKQLASEHHLILTGRNFSKLQALQEELKKNHPWNYEIYSLDYSQKQSIEFFKNQLVSKPPISGLVLISPRPQFHGKELFQEEETWLEVLKTTFTGPVEVLKTVVPYLSSNSKIIAIAGTTSTQYQPEAGPTCVIRRMWTAYMKALSHQLGPQNISINTISPGVILTDFHQTRIQKQAQQNKISYEEQMEQETLCIPLRRHGKPEEVAQAIQFLLSEQSDFINGINLILDGGYTVSY